MIVQRARAVVDPHHGGAWPADAEAFENQRQHDAELAKQAPWHVGDVAGGITLDGGPGSLVTTSWTKDARRRECGRV